MDIREVAAATGWTVNHLDSAASTNDVAAEMLRSGASARTAVIADRQTQGRGRVGRAFFSPPGGLYLSLLLDAPAEDLPAVVVALAGVAAAEAIEEVGAPAVRLKWPNDLWIEERKVGGILLEATDAGGPVVVGIGINLEAVPADLPAGVRSATAALTEVVDGAVDRGELVVALLAAVDAWEARRGEGGWPDALEGAWRARLALIGEPVTFTFAGREMQGVLEDAALREGLLVRDPLSGPVWRQAEHVQDLRSAARTIS